MIDLNDSFIMSKDDFKDFLKILNFFSDGCNDLHMVDKLVFQRTNNRAVAIRCDLSNLIKFDGEIIFCDIKKLVINLKGLNKNGPIRFKRFGNTIRIKDTVTSIDIPVGNKVYIDNEIITEADFNKIFNPGQILMESEMDNYLCEAITKCSKSNNSQTVTLSIQNEKAVLRFGEPGGGDINREFKFSYKLFKQMPDCTINLSTKPFNLKTASTLKIYFDINNNRIVFSVFTITINQNIAFEIYGRCSIIEKEED